MFVGKNGVVGSRVSKVRVNVGKPDEFADLSKDKTGLGAKPNKGTKAKLSTSTITANQKLGQFYVFESQYEVTKQISQSGGRFMDFSVLVV